MATVIIPTPLRKFTNNTSRLSIQATSVSELIQKIISDFPEMKTHLLDVNGKVPSFLNIFVDDDDIRNLQLEKTLVNDNTTVSIVPAIAGGSPSK